MNTPIRSTQTFHSIRCRMKHLSKAKFKSLIIWIMVGALILGASACKSEQRSLSSLPAMNTSAADKIPDPVAPPVPSSGVVDAGGTGDIKALYLGVAGYGGPKATKENKDHFTYRFKVDGKEVTYSMYNGEKIEGEYSYPIQNILKRGYMYNIKVEEGVITSAEQVKTGEYEDFEPVVKGEPGVKTLTNFIKTALMPVGTALYVYGGGWDWQDSGSGFQTRTIGVSPDWIRFFKERNEDYTYKDSKKPSESYYPFGEYNEFYYAGLDCSGYLGWVLYNTFEKTDGRPGYVQASTGFAKDLSKYYGTFTKETGKTKMAGGLDTKPGDIVSIKGHVWISLGTCADGSTLMLHSNPSESRSGMPGGGVQIGAIGTSKDCEAYKLARNYAARYYPDWYSRYNIYLCNPLIYFDFTEPNAGIFSWDTSISGGLTDPDGIRNLTPAVLLARFYN